MNLANKEICNGCAACYNICPIDAITMKSDFEGFEYPIIDDEKCINCSLCENVCPVINKYKREMSFQKPKVFAAWSNDKEIRLNSTTGGIFSELAKLILNDGGIVVGAKYNDENEIEHYAIGNIQELYKLRQSKYVQSSIGFIYRKIKQNLASGKKVLFCGTPCHNAALSNFLNKKYDNLILCDFICRGVNSPKVYRKYLDMLEKKYNSKIVTVHFKNKTFGWNRFSTKIEFNNSTYYIKDRYNDLFMVGYIEKNLYMRPSCHNCCYKGLPRVSDITLADFWGISNTRPNLDQDKGTSAVLLNTQKGLNLFQQFDKQVFKEECTIEEVISGNPYINLTPTKSTERSQFFNDLDRLPFDKLMKKYGSDKLIIKYIKRFLKHLYRLKNLIIGSLSGLYW